ncbi:hypothetical protein [Microbacterium sp. NPDC055683]
MNTIHLSRPHPPQPQAVSRLATELSVIPERTPRTSAADRLAMRIGLRLLLWGTRPADAQERARAHHERLRTAEAARREHELAVARAHLLHGTPFIR